MKNKSGKFVLIAGGTHAGKTTQSKELVRNLEAMDYSVAWNTEPTRTNPFGVLIRKLIEGRARTEDFRAAQYLAVQSFPNTARIVAMDICARGVQEEPLSESDRQTIFMLDRLEDCHCIQSLIESGKIVIQDRYDESTLAHGAAHGYDPVELARFQLSLIGKNYTPPDLMIFIAVDPAVAYKRAVASGKVLDIYDTPESIAKIAVAYEQIIPVLRQELGYRDIVSVDGNQSPEKVYADIFMALQTHGILS